MLERWLRELSAGMQVPLAEVRILAQHVFKFSRSQLITSNLCAAPESQRAQLQALIKRRANGEPIAYLTQEREFYSRRFTVTSDVLIPRHDTETLIDAVLNLPLPANARVIDLGTGSGCIGITLALERPNWQVTITDLSSAALAVARANCKALGAQVSSVQSNWWQDIPAQTFDLIVSNPPYIAAGDQHLNEGDLRFEPASALTCGVSIDDGLTAYQLICASAAHYGNPASWLAFEHGWDQATGVINIMHHRGWSQLQTLNDLSGQPRVSVGRLL